MKFTLLPFKSLTLLNRIPPEQQGIQFPLVQTTCTDDITEFKIWYISKVWSTMQIKGFTPSNWERQTHSLSSREEGPNSDSPQTYSELGTFTTHTSTSSLESWTLRDCPRNPRPICCRYKRETCITPFKSFTLLSHNSKTTTVFTILHSQFTRKGFNNCTLYWYKKKCCTTKVRASHPESTKNIHSLHERKIKNLQCSLFLLLPPSYLSVLKGGDCL